MIEPLFLPTADGLQGTFEFDPDVPPCFAEWMSRYTGMSSGKTALPCRCRVHRLNGNAPAGVIAEPFFFQLVPPQGHSPADFYIAERQKYPLVLQTLCVKIGLLAGLMSSLLQRNLFLVHGGLARSPEGKGVLFSGPSGVGKSTAAEKLLHANWELLADDFLLLGRQNGRWFAQGAPTYSAWRLEKPQLVTCRIDTIISVDAVMILGRGENHVSQLVPKMAQLALSRAFADMLKWHLHFLCDTPLKRELTEPLFQMNYELSAGLPVIHVANTKESDIAALFQQGLETLSGR